MCWCLFVIRWIGEREISGCGVGRCVGVVCYGVSGVGIGDRISWWCPRVAKSHLHNQGITFLLF